jgi:hypothetical protein
MIDVDEAEQARRDEQYREYLQNKKRREKRGWADWDERDIFTGERIFPPSRILDEPLRIEPPIAPRRTKRIRNDR